MSKDYFQDILPHNDKERRTVPIHKTSPSEAPEHSEQPLHEEVSERSETGVEAGRSIRNISINHRRERRQFSEPVPPTPVRRREGRSMKRLLMWAIACLSVLVLAGLLLLSFRGTVVTVTPRTQTVVFDQTSRFIAQPEDNETATGLTYSVRTIELEESEVVAGDGVVFVEDRASGSITVFNDVSATPVRLVRNTRFESTGGLIFRTPTEVTVPGRTSSGPGRVTVTIVADEPGDRYNVAAGRFTLPGLRSSPNEYAGIYGEAASSMSGGFAGEKPNVSQTILDSTLSQMRDRIEQRAREAVQAEGESSVFIFSSLMNIEYQNIESTPEGEGTVRVRQNATVHVPILSSEALAAAVARTVAADADGASIRIVPSSDFAAQGIEEFQPGETLQFTISGTVQLVWDVDTEALAEALTGRDQAAFQVIVNGFSSIQSARARIEPFWASSFPESAADIAVVVEDPTRGQGSQ